ncbi:MAG: Stp1/IreP family PP2C-type Ser/Thr phosphatase [Clostridia bacterium]|nr:Stp1/IreP family PP2C-type Ser/Thr phosphatase [Clostridia bacterium]
MQFSAKTDVGRYRQSNQDSFLVGELPDSSVFAVVCDGMGGHAGGNVASSTAAERIADEIKKNYRENMTSSSVKNMIESAVVLANLDITEEAEKNTELEGMGTTAVVAVITPVACVVANVGDSRCYRIHSGEIAQLTKDHSLVQEMVDAGLISQEDAANHPRKNIITRALGIADDVKIDFFDTDFVQGDKLLLCTDGLTNHVSDSGIAQIIDELDADSCAEALVALANMNGGTDNITAVVIYNS